MEYRKRNISQSRLGGQLGNYRLIRLLGQGSFADVYLGEHVHLNTQASIKVLDMRLTNDDMGDFLAEARTIARLRHPYIIQVLEFGVEGNTPFLVMDYAPNGTLRQRYSVGTILSPEIILPHVNQMAAALQHAHDEKIIHRDIKPENMLLGHNGELLLSDFGIAVVAHSSRTQSMRGVAGTVAYMAPEQLQGKPVFASDQYSLGVIVYEWLSGSCPFEGSFVEIATRHTHVPPPPLSEKIPTISPAVEKVVLRALAKDPQQRFASVQEFAQALEEACQSEEPSVEVSSSDTAPLAPLTPVQEVNVLPPQETTMTTYYGHSAAVNAVAWSPLDPGDTKFYRSRIASASDDGTVQIWNALTGRKTATFRGHSGAVRALAWSPDVKRIASAGVDGTVQVWDAANLHKVLVYTGHSGEVTDAAWSPDGTRIASASRDNTVHVWEAITGRREIHYQGHSQPVLSIAWSPGGQYIASAGEDMTVQVWQVATGNTVLTYQDHSHEVLSVAWSPDGEYIASGGADQVVQVWEATSGNIIFTYRGHQFTVSAIAWSPDGRRIASASFDRTVHVWDAPMSLIHARNDAGFTSQTFGNDAGASNTPHSSERKESSSMRSVRMQGVAGYMAISYPGHSNWVHALAWAPGGQYIASASGDKTVQVWLTV